MRVLIILALVALAAASHGQACDDGADREGVCGSCKITVGAMKLKLVDVKVVDELKERAHTLCEIITEVEDKTHCHEAFDTIIDDEIKTAIATPNGQLCQLMQLCVNRMMMPDPVGMNICKPCKTTVEALKMKLRDPMVIEYLRKRVHTLCEMVTEDQNKDHCYKTFDQIIVLTTRVMMVTTNDKLCAMYQFC